MSSMITIDFRDRSPIYEQLVSCIKQLIIHGVFTENEQLPSVRSLAAELGINPNTIQKAYTELERQGIAYTVSGKGCFIADTAENIKKARKSEILKLLEDQAKQATELSIPLSELQDAINKGYNGGKNND